MSILELSNRIIFQWFFVRLTRCSQRIIDEVEMVEVSMLHDGCHGVGGNILKSHREQWYSFQGWIIPLTGWNTDFRYIGKSPWFKKMSTIKSVA